MTSEIERRVPIASPSHVHEIHGEDCKRYCQVRMLNRGSFLSAELHRNAKQSCMRLTNELPVVVMIPANSLAQPSMSTARLEIAQPAMMKGRRRPSEDLQPSLSTPTIGCTNNPDNGPVG